MTYKLVMKIEPIHAPAGVSISELKKNPSAVIAAAGGCPLAILNRNKPAAYLVPPEAWEAILEQLDDLELVRIVNEREGEEGIPVDIDEL
jgi:antitoxin StbD